MPVAEICREHGVSNATYYQWKTKYAGGKPSELRRLRELEAENARLKRMYPDLALENTAIKEVREVPEELIAAKLSITRACRITGLSWAVYYKRPQPALQRDAAVIDALNGVVEEHRRWGFWKCFHRLRLDGHRWNKKRVHRVYCEMGLNLRNRTRKRLVGRVLQPLDLAHEVNRCWTLDFALDAAGRFARST